jgi:hypothetical protein
MSSLSGFCHWLADTQGSIALRESIWTYPLVESVHVLTLTVFGGLTVLVDLRLLGAALGATPVSELLRRLLPWMIGGFLVMFASGLLLFYAVPVRTSGNVFFRLKVVLLLAAGLNAALFHVMAARTLPAWDRERSPPWRARLAGGLSLALWAAIVICGRMTAYDWFDADPAS